MLNTDFSKNCSNFYCTNFLYSRILVLQTSKMHLCVVGGGIVGFNTALQLFEKFPNARVTIIADKFDEETTSYRAAGIFRPSTNFCGPTPDITKEWINYSYNYYNDLLNSPEAPSAGISLISGYIFASEHYSLTRNSFLEGLVPIYRKATTEELQICPGNWKFGSFFTTLLIESHSYLPWAKKKFLAAGGTILKEKVEKWDDLLKDSLNNSTAFDAVFNCTGFGSKWLCNDTKVVPVRGQILKVKAPWIKMFFYGDYDTYIVPGQRSVTLGGCRQLDSYDTSISKHDSNAIWERCTELLPSLRNANIESTMVGLRPHRDIVRCELEEVLCEGKRLKVIHNYGHGGYGVTSAPGTAAYAVKLFQNSLKQHNNFSKSTLEKHMFAKL